MINKLLAIYHTIMLDDYLLNKSKELLLDL